MATPGFPREGWMVPTLKYADAPAAIDWLCRAFGFHKHAVYAGEDGVVQHAQLTFGAGMIMLGSAGQTEFDALQKPPAAVGGVGTQSPYILVADPDAVYARAKAAGARIAYDIRDEDYGGRGFSCLDPEGHLWNFGSYDPWVAAPAPSPDEGR